MSAGSVSLTSAINVCRVGSGEAERMNSDRFLNPMNMVCPIWNGTNLKGQQVCPDSFNTKRRGCNSALDRVLVESNLRPDYSSYLTLNPMAIKGNIYADQNPSARSQVNGRTAMLKHLDNTTPGFGDQKGASRRSVQGGRHGSCSIGAYERAMAAEQENFRTQGAMENYANANNYQKCSGGY